MNAPTHFTSPAFPATRAEDTDGGWLYLRIVTARGADTPPPLDTAITVVPAGGCGTVVLLKVQAPLIGSTLAVPIRLAGLTLFLYSVMLLEGLETVPWTFQRLCRVRYSALVIVTRSMTVMVTVATLEAADPSLAV
jgi:hypothetical protein